ncbi:amino acid ABC transporter substrate-binding protein (PAAT family) [Sinobacterium caligoides]|uniref:Amino acid ABC transporter substrate-binding protein (PAAT family) n=1 Tax=Sinobacterium caligoides TaxID=933926 RepID=A0A3N2DJP0_9GAMM|nr:amino acid ABC transporter substrate-binding protein [Sinobacterium caligoides]ROR99908.1 amino acid ABC transporter substrate-binding protein (PAAT family) [Sinobacterium caligoides]
MRQLFKAITVLIVTIGLSACSQESPDGATKGNQITVGMSGTYFPFTFSKNDQLQGFEVDVWKAIGMHLGREVDFVTTNFSGLFGMLEAGKIDTISNQITVTDKRKEQFYFATPYVYDGAQLVVHKDNSEINSTDDLCGKKVAVNFGSNFADMLRKLDNSNCINIVTYDVGIEQDVVLGRSDAFVMDRTSAVALIEESGLPLKLAGNPFQVLTNSFPFVKDATGLALRDEVNGAISALRADGTLTTISNKWFHEDITQAVKK